MGKYSFHRPASRASTSRATNREDSHRQKTARGRWTLHNPEQVTPDHGTGWYPEDVELTRRQQGLTRGRRWSCHYGCKSFVWTEDPKPGQYHAWDCPYWANEGKHLTPFDS